MQKTSVATKNLEVNHVQISYSSCLDHSLGIPQVILKTDQKRFCFLKCHYFFCTLVTYLELFCQIQNLFILYLFIVYGTGFKFQRKVTVPTKS